MTIEQATSWFRSLNEEAKAQFAAGLSSELTIIARVGYANGSDDVDGARLRSVNELLHRTTGFVRDLLSHHEERYPDDVFISIVLESSEDADLNREILAAFDRVAVRMGAQPALKTA